MRRPHGPLPDQMPEVSIPQQPQRRLLRASTPSTAVREPIPFLASPPDRHGRSQILIKEAIRKSPLREWTISPEGVQEAMPLPYPSEVGSRELSPAAWEGQTH